MRIAARPPRPPRFEALRLPFTPRNSIERIVAADPARWVLVLASLDGLTIGASFVLSYPPEPDLGFLAMFWLAVMCLAAPLGVANLYFQSLAMRIAGRLLGGHASAGEVRAALAWASVPGIAARMPALVVLVVVGWVRGVHGATTEAWLPFAWLGWAAGLWSAVLSVATVAKVEGFSLRRSVAVSMLALPVRLALAAVVGFGVWGAYRLLA